MPKGSKKGQSPSKLSSTHSPSDGKASPTSGEMDKLRTEDDTYAESMQQVNSPTISFLLTATVSLFVKDESEQIRNTGHVDMSEEDSGTDDENDRQSGRSSSKKRSPKRSTFVPSPHSKYSDRSGVSAGTEHSLNSSNSMRSNGAQQSSEDHPNVAQKPPRNHSKNIQALLPWFLLGIAVIYGMWPKGDSDSSSNDKHWRSKIDPSYHLLDNQRSMVFASLKPILEKSSTRQDEGLSTLLILSSNEEVAAKLGRCLLQRVNQQSNNDKVNLLNRTFLRTIFFSL